MDTAVQINSLKLNRQHTSDKISQQHSARNPQAVTFPTAK